VGFGNDRSVKLTVGASLDDLTREFARGERAGQQFSTKLQKSAVDAAKGLAKVKNEAREVATPLLAIGTIAAVGVGYAIKSYADFEEKMSSVKSLSHATTSEMGDLKQAALTTGSAIGFSATQAADAEIELVKAGISASDIYGGALAGSLKLAAAGQIDVADATSIAASTLTQFGLKGRDVTHIADLLAAGADKALGGVSDLGEGLKYIGPVAAAAHIGLEQTVGSLALLAQNGIMGEQAGTGLRGMLLSLTAPSQLASDTMRQYGINVYDASGKFVGFNGVAEQLHTKLGTLGDAQRDAALGTIFGNAQITTATILMKGGAAAVDEWTKAVNEQGFATEQAVGKMDNLNGDVTKLKASFQTASIVTGEAANGPLRDLVQVGTDMIDTYNKAPGVVQAVVLGVGALTAVVALGSGTMLIAIPKVVAYGAALSTLEKANLPGVSKAAGGALNGAKKLGAGLGKTASFLTGPWGLALAAGGLAVAAFNHTIDSGTVSQSELTNAISTNVGALKTLELAGQRSAASKFLIGDVGKDLKDLPSLLKQIGTNGVDAAVVFESIKSGFAHPFDKQYDGIASLKEQVKSVQDYGSALAQVAAADAPAAARSFSALAKQQHLSSAQTSQLLDNMADYKAQLTNQASSLGITASKTNLLLLATGQYKKAAASAKEPTRENSNALKELQKSGEDAAKAIDETAKALKGLTSPTLDARAAERDFQAAVDAVTSSIKDNGKSLDINTDKGRNNQAALDAIAQTAENAAGAIYQQTGSQEKATAAMQSGRDELVKALGQYGITGAAAQAYADQIIGTPRDWATLFENNAPEAGQKVDNYKKKVADVPLSKLTTLLAEKEAAEKKISDLKANIYTVPATKRTELTAEIGAAEANLRSLNAQLAAVPRIIGIDVAVHTNTTGLPTDASLQAQMGLRRAGGGPIYGPGTATSDSIPLWGSNGEFMMQTRAVSKYGLSTMHAINQGLLSKSQLMSAFSDGVKSKQQVMSMAGARGYASGGEITPTSYARPSTQVVVVQGGGGSMQPLVGNLTVPVPAGATVKQTVDEVMFALRSKQGGSR
jgi:TP901 family phage tail tape measure protein